MKYSVEKEFIISQMLNAYSKSIADGLTKIEQKSAFDLVTNVDKEVEVEISAAIKKQFPTDNIHGEETSGNQQISGRTWTIDPIDGTCNMASAIPLYGVQCSLFDDDDVVLSAIYLPHWNYLLYAIKGQGCYLNDKRVYVKKDNSVTNAIVSFGDYPHAKHKMALRQHKAVARLYPQIAKIRMFGAACIDFALVAAGKTDGTVVITKNLWDIAPGILLCREAGAIVTNLEGKPYCFGDEGVVCCANEVLSQMISTAFKNNFTLQIGEKTYSYNACIFDFDGVVFNTEKYHHLAWVKALSVAKVNVSFTWEEYLPLKSRGREPIFAYLQSKLNAPLTQTQVKTLNDEKTKAYNQLIQQTTDDGLIDGVVDFLHYLEKTNVKTAVASSSTSTKQIVSQLNLNTQFNAVLDGNLSVAKKPSPQIFNLAASQISEDATQCLVFEDAQSGIDAAISAGMDVVAVGIKSDKALLCIDDFTQITQYLKN